MAVLEMKAVTIAGRLKDFERIVTEYVIGRDIHLENAITVLEDKDKLIPYGEDNQYAAIGKNTLEILELAGIKPENDKVFNSTITREEMLEKLDYINSLINDKRQEKLNLEKTLRDNKRILKQLEAMSDFDVDLPKLFTMEFIKFRFGKMPKGGYKTLETYLGNIEAVFMKTGEDDDDVWGFYFVPKDDKEKVDAIFASLYFERVFISDKVVGTPIESTDTLIKENEDIKVKIKAAEAEIKKLVETSAEELSDIYNISKKNQMFAEVKKYAAHSDEFFYIIGWMSAKQEKKLRVEIEKEEGIIFFEETPDKVEEQITPPTKLKNNRIFKPFEMFVNMYGLPSYNEIDPTPILAITYILIFGIMFGDVGQSAIFALLGFILYKKTRQPLAAMVSMVGVSGIGFGFVYGSIFGNETILEHIRIISPMHSITTMLLASVSMGAFIIIMCMLLNILNSIKSKNWGKMLFSQNGIAGLVFYVSLLVIAVGSVLKMNIPTGVLIFLIIIMLIFMYLQEPFSHLIEGKKHWLPRSKMFYVESFFEMFDILLSFITNTISFLRVGAFAVIHVGMMLAVSVLAGSGPMSIVIKIIGNIIVMGLEGLIVGIQVLRLEYYEMFSRYFNGKGKKFESIKN